MPSMSATSQSPHFREIQKFVTDYAPACLTQYESTRTGMRVVVVDQEGPTVHGSFTLATEIHDDSGAPHTLEHLCFMGSKSYRYKSFLDKLATRGYSDTNAWTATDYTEYTLNSAGWEGFAQILPVYLEHIIVPTLTDSACYTEVHHVDGSGHDAGVVYSEMQAEQNEKDMLLFVNNKRMLYPEEVGFRYETFGMMDTLRDLTADRIREYHCETYQPKNLCLVIVGAVDHSNLLHVLENFEETILEDIPKPDAPFKRPWVDSPQAPPLKHSLVGTVEFPEEDETSGEVMLSFFGPNRLDSQLCRAIVCLLRYLAGSSASVLENTLVEKEQLASAVVYDYESRPTTVVSFNLTGVSTEKLEHVEARFLEILTGVAAKPIDLDYMKDCIKAERRQVKFLAEESSSKFFSDPIIKDFLFGNRDGSTLQGRMKNLRDYDTLEAWNDSEWRHRLKSWFVEAPHVTMFGRPSAKIAKTFKREEKARVSLRKKDLGEAGLKELDKKLTAAKAENEVEIPKEVLERFEVPGTRSIHFITTITARSGAARAMGSLENPIQKMIDQDSDLPLFIHFEHTQSNFANLTIVLGTELVPIALRPLLSIYMDNFFSSPMQQDGTLVDFEKVIMGLERETVGYEIDTGQRIGNSEVIAIKLQVELEKYQAAILWFRDLMFSSIFDIERIKATTTRMLADIPEEKRNGSNMSSAIELIVGTEPSSLGHACNTLTSAVYLKRVKQSLEEDPETILEQLKQINAALCQPYNLRILVIANIEKLHNPVSSWQTLIEGLDTTMPLKPLDTRLSRLSNLGSNPGNLAYIVPIPSIDSSFLLVISKGPSSYNDPAIPALMVATAYLNAVEGPLWTATRGTGLAYGTNVYQHVDSGQISLSIYRTPDATKAFIASKDVVQDLVSGKSAMDKFALEGAISSIVLNFANAEDTMLSAAQSSFIRQVIRDLPKNWPEIVLERVRKVTAEEIGKAMKEVVLPLFDAMKANLFVTCAPVMEKKIVMGFGELGFKSEVKPLAFFQDDYGLKAGEGADGEEAGDDADMDDEEEKDDDSEDPEGENDEDEDEDSEISE